jgi:hypothetical protein
MAVYKQISSKSIIRKVMRDLSLSTDNWIEDAIEWMGEALEHIGAAPQLEKKVCTLTVDNYTTCLPSDLYYINLVGINDAITPAIKSELKVITDQIAEIKAVYDNNAVAVVNPVVENPAGRTSQTESPRTAELNTELFKLNSRLAILESLHWQNQDQLTPLSYATSEFPVALHCDKCINIDAKTKETYFINGGKIKTSFETGTICLSYMAFPTDEDCYPLVPDEISFKEAMFWFIYKKLLLRDPNTKNNGIGYDIAEQQWKYYCTQARNAANYPDIDRYESFLNQWVRLIPRISEHDSNFDSLNTREQLNRDH